MPDLVIEDIQYAKRPTELCRITLSSGETLSFYPELVIQHHLHAGRRLTSDELQQLIEENTYYLLKQKAFQYLSYRACSVLEMKRKLLRKGFPEAQIEEVLHELIERGYLNDAQYAMDYVRSRAHRYGPRRLQAELQRKGIAQELIVHALQKHMSEDETAEQALQWARKKQKQLLSEPNPWKRRKKLQDFLLRKGYDYETIGVILAQLEKED